MTFLQAFEKIKARLADVDETKLSDDFAIQVNLTNKDCGGIFYIEYKNGVLSVEPYDYHDRTAMVSLMAGDLTKMADRKMDPIKAVESGKIQIEGNAGHLLMFIEAVKPAEKKAAPKKAAGAQKTEAPKTPEKKAAAKKTAKKTTKES